MSTKLFGDVSRRWRTIPARIWAAQPKRLQAWIGCAQFIWGSTAYRVSSWPEAVKAWGVTCTVGFPVVEILLMRDATFGFEVRPNLR